MSARPLGLAIAMLGCGAQVTQLDSSEDGNGDDAPGDTSSASNTVGTTHGTSGGGPTTAVDASTSGDDVTPGSGAYEDDDGGTGCAFTCPPPPTTGGGGGSFECDLVAQDCPEQEKCMPWANDGGPLWNASRCSPLDPDPIAPDQICTVEGSGISGIDNCALGSMCWEVDPKTNIGVCRQLCVAPSEPCPGGLACFTYVPGLVELCVPSCDPLAPECELGTCAASSQGFACVPGGAQAQGDPCADADDCASGSLCLSGDLLPGCSALGCCAAVCDLQLADPCGEDLACTPWDADAIPPWDDVGVCIAG
jgi:hypothetical protein